jgi:uncharacterized protein (TIGR03437 family)
VGIAVQLTPRQDPLATVEDLDFTNNTIRNCTGGVNFLGVDNYAPGSTRQHNIRIFNNLFDQIGTEAFIQVDGVYNLVVSHNTAIHKGNIIMTYGESSTGFVFTDNIVENNLYGMIGDGGVPLSTYFPDGILRNNVNVGGSTLNYPNDFTPAQLSAVGFFDLSNRDYRLLASSPYTGKATDGKDIGIDFALLTAAQAGGAPSPTPTPGPKSRTSVERARDYANSLIDSPDGFPSGYVKATTGNGSNGRFTLAAASDLISLTKEIERAYGDFTAERNLYGAAADSVEKQILGGLYFSRTVAALAGRLGISPSVKDHLRRIIAHLSMAYDLMLYGSITPVTAAQAAAVNARADLIIGTVSSGYTPTSSALLAPASLGSVFGNSGQSPFSTQSVFAALSSHNELPYELGGVCVTLGGQAVTIVYVSPSRVTFFIPADLALGSEEVIVASQNGYISRGTTTIAQNVFRIMTTAEDDTGPAVAMNSGRQTGNDFDVITPENFGPDTRTRLTVFATGISGSAANSDPSNDITVEGVVQPNFAESVAVEARLSNGQVISLPVEYAGPEGTLPGLDQLNVLLSPELRGAGTVGLTLIIGGQRSNAPTITVR